MTSLSAGDWRLLALAAATLVQASSLVARAPFERAVRFGSVPVCRAGRPVDPQRLAWAIRAASRRIPLRTKCIEQGIALQRLLRRRGMDAVLHYGVRTGGTADRDLGAHVWVSLGEQILIGGDESSDFAEVAQYP